MKKDLEKNPDFPGGRRLENPVSGLAVNIKELLPKGTELPCPPSLRPPSDERLPVEKEQSPLPLVWEGFFKSSWRNQGILEG